MELCADITRKHTVTVSWDVCVLIVLAYVGFVWLVRGVLFLFLSWGRGPRWPRTH